jgi:AAA domain
MRTNVRMPKDVETRVRRSHTRVAPVTFTGNELRDKQFAPITWAIPDILPAGATLFGGREKMGKSWLGFSLCIAVATGGYALGKMSVEQGDALYLSLEDPERRLHKRIRRLAREETDLSHFHYATEWQPADSGGLEDLSVWLEGVMNFSPYTIASGHGYSKTIPQ